MKLSFSFNCVDAYDDFGLVNVSFDVYSIPDEVVLEKIRLILSCGLTSICDRNCPAGVFSSVISCIDSYYYIIAPNAKFTAPFHASLISDFPEITMRALVYPLQKCVDLLKKNWNENKRKK